MKKIIVSLLLFFFSSPLLACPFCGCGNSNFQVGILPNYNKAFMGVRYTYTHFNTLSADGLQFSHDYFHSTELWGGAQLGKFQVMAFVPYLTSHKLSDDGVINDHGIGDITSLVNYRLWSVTGAKSSHSLLIGGGVKFQTGHSSVDTANPDFTVGEFSSTPGTGSTDYLLNVAHTFLFGNHGVVSNATYRFNTVNAQQFQYGNRIYFNTVFFRSWTAGSTTIRPSIGLNLVINAVNRYQGLTITDSQGHLLSGLAGVNVQYGKVGFMINGFLPVAQNLFANQTKLASRASAGITFSF